MEDNRMEVSEIPDNSKVIHKCIRKYDPNGMIITETTTTIVGKSLKECHDYYERVRKTK